VCSPGVRAVVAFEVEEPLARSPPLGPSLPGPPFSMSLLREASSAFHRLFSLLPYTAAVGRGREGGSKRRFPAFSPKAGRATRRVFFSLLSLTGGRELIANAKTPPPFFFLRSPHNDDRQRERIPRPLSAPTESSREWNVPGCSTHYLLLSFLPRSPALTELGPGAGRPFRPPPPSPVQGGRLAADI